jgi:hypothetical protein
MPGFLTVYHRRKILRHRTGVELYVPPAAFYVALTTAILTPHDQTIPPGIELSGAGYVAQLVANDATAWSDEVEDPDTGILTSSLIVDIAYPQATANYTQAFGWALKDGPGPNDNVWEAGAWEGTPIQPQAGEIPTILAGQILRRSLP